MSVKEEILAVTDWRHPHEIEGLELDREELRNWHPWRLSIDAPNLSRIAGGSLAGKRILDTGCNDGWFAFEYEKLGAITTGLEARAEAVRRANLIKSHFAYESEFLQGDVEDEAFFDSLKRRKFDIVLFYGILYHLTDPINVLRRMGMLASRAIAIQTWMNGEDREPVLRFRRDPQHMPGSGTSELVLSPSQSAIYHMLRNAGFDHVYRADPRPYPMRQWNKRAGPQWHFGFFYGVKGEEPVGLNAVKIDAHTPPINPYSWPQRLYGFAELAVRRATGRGRRGSQGL
jgi:SAM-dependent methyltransferase